MPKKFIKNFTIEDASSYFQSIGEKPYRARQLFNWLYEFNVDSFAAMTNFSKTLRAKLDEDFLISPLTLEERLISADGSEKYLFKTHDGHFIESVLIRRDDSNKERTTICISSQIGCPMGCLFCNTARIGYVRNLETAEILDQICQVRRISGIKNDNVVFMGMGEPFLNYDSVMRAAEIMNYSFGFHISVRRITISTCGIIKQIERYIDEKRPYNLAISVNDTIPQRRAQLMPVEKTNPIEKVARLLERKFPATRNRVTLEYVMRSDNIEEQDALRLKKLFRHSKIKINLIRLNQTALRLDPPSNESIEKFVKALEVMNVPITIRKSFGEDIDAACGQLSGKRYDHRIQITQLTKGIFHEQR
ncbi:MAG: 23S rRNA (adenine(2503)-C(2))-methyltransferase RlmN [Spirochaetes bacterium]|nr:23S rRNA (adenine(2503)-C(2))-methyltransferase RlmN [Spirochaetota bacterium]